MSTLEGVAHDLEAGAVDSLRNHEGPVATAVVDHEDVIDIVGDAVDGGGDVVLFVERRDHYRDPQTLVHDFLLGSSDAGLPSAARRPLLQKVHDLALDADVVEPIDGLNSRR